MFHFFLLPLLIFASFLLAGGKCWIADTKHASKTPNEPPEKGGTRVCVGFLVCVCVCVCVAWGWGGNRVTAVADAERSRKVPSNFLHNATRHEKITSTAGCPNQEGVHPNQESG